MGLDKTARTRDLFLFWISSIYMFAFGSIYTQIPGLMGRNGIIPVHRLLRQIKDQTNAKTTEALYLHTPTLLWFLPFEFELGLELIALIGMLTSFLCFLFQSLRVGPMFLLQWLLYLSLYKVGQTFLWFQWDILLLEVGFLCVLVAPLFSKQSDSETGANIHRQIPFWLVRWLLFRLMFASGVVKLTSECPTWWKLTALNYHYESQCIPTPVAWWAHQLPAWFQQLSVLATYVIEILLPFLFFSPLRFSRLVACYAQVFLMAVIALTGNYNFFNLLTVVLCISLVDDEHVNFVKNCFLWNRGRKEKAANVKNESNRFFAFAVNAFVFAVLLGICYKLTSYNWSFKLNFTSDDLNRFLLVSMPIITWLACGFFVLTAVSVIFKSLNRNVVKTLLVLLPATYIFAISMVPFSSLESNFNRELWPVVKRWHSSSHNFELVHSYGLFRRMTGVGGRPEVVIEGSNHLDGPWKEYEFVHKPGDPKSPLTWTGPHQPRLDWQLWFAALGSYQHNPWFVSLLHRLLTGQEEVLDLLDRGRLPFDRPPKYVRSKLYTYHYTKLRKDGSVPRAWWKRKFEKEYTPPLTESESTMMDFLKYNKMLPVGDKVKPQGKIENAVFALRQYTKKVSAPRLLWSLVIAALAMSAVAKHLFGKSKEKSD